MSIGYEELRHATGDFDESNKIGSGGFGVVYKGEIAKTLMAIKVLKKVFLSFRQRGEGRQWRKWGGGQNFLTRPSTTQPMFFF